ncbi:MAG: hypothetical protein IJE43_00635 [Alphaproteobacteria bacterium]|nr:hypothetical protein [Alphaproteobacteria bacterium]
MNVYFMNPRYISSDNINIFLEVLKVNQIINLINPESYNIPDIDSKIETFSYFTEDKHKLLKEAVHKFISPISKPIIKDGKWSGDIEVLDLYKNSYSGNPIHNLIKCKEDNVIVFIDNYNDFLANFAEYTIAILTKYGSKYKYYDRICFCKIDKSLNNTWIYLEKKQKCLICKIQESLYDPLLSYINIKVKERHQHKIGSNSIFKFLLTSEGFIEYENKLFILSVNVFNNRINRNKYYQASRPETSEEYNSFDRGEEEFHYIMENGGDWIRD